MTNVNFNIKIVLGAVAVLAITGAPRTAAAQKENSSSAISAAEALKKKVDLNVENADIRYALKLLFNAVGVNYTIDPAVQGTVTASLKDIPFRTGLETLLKTVASQTPITYRVEDNVYYVSPRVETPAEVGHPSEPDPAPAKRTKITKIQLNFIDPEDLAQVLGGTVIRTRFGTNALLLNGNGQGNQLGQNGFNQGFGQNGFGQSGFGQGQFGSSGFGNGFGSGTGYGVGNGTGFGSGFGSIGRGNGSNGGGRMR